MANFRSLKIGELNNPGERFVRWLFILLGLVVPVLVGYEIYYQSRTPTDDLPLDWQTGRLHRVPEGSFAQSAGLMAGDIIANVDGTPFGECNDLIVGSYPVEIEREGRLFTLKIPVVPFVKVNQETLASAVAVALTFWGLSLVVLLRRFRRADARLLFLVMQVCAIAVLLLLTNPPLWVRPDWMMHVNIGCFHLAAPLLLHYMLTFPVILGTPHQRQWGVSLLYGLAVLLFLCRVLSSNLVWIRSSILFATLEMAAAAGVLGYVYFYRANPDSRRRLRLIVLGTILAIAPPTLFFLYLAVTGAPYRIPPWLMGITLPLAPLCYFYAIVRHNLFGIDRLLNRTLVYTILSLGIFALYLGLFLVLYPLLPDEPLLQTALIAGLTLLVSLSFDWTRTQIQQLVDRLFYGGWYDYPGVVETVSDALTRTLEREQLAHVLTQQVPGLMQLYEGQLWLGEASTVPPPKATPPQINFPSPSRVRCAAGGRQGHGATGRISPIPTSASSKPWPTRPRSPSATSFW